MAINFKNNICSSYFRVWIVILLLAIGIVLLKTGCSAKTPTIQHVLLNCKRNDGNDFMPFIWLFIFIAFLTIGKLYLSSLKKNALLKDQLIHEKKSPNNEGVLAEINSLIKENEVLKKENCEIQRKLKVLLSETNEFRQVEDVLKKGNVALARECERLRVENLDLLEKLESRKPKISKRKSTRSAKKEEGKK